MSTIRTLPPTDTRVETGPIRFGDDWPGTFIRGDHAFHYAEALTQLLDKGAPLVDTIQRALLLGLLSELRNSDLTKQKSRLSKLLNTPSVLEND